MNPTVAGASVRTVPKAARMTFVRLLQAVGLYNMIRSILSRKLDPENPQAPAWSSAKWKRQTFRMPVV